MKIKYVYVKLNFIPRKTTNNIKRFQPHKINYQDSVCQQLYFILENTINTHLTRRLL